MQHFQLCNEHMLNSCTVLSPARLSSDKFGRFHLQTGATDGFPGLRLDKSTAWTAAKPRIDYSLVIFRLFPLPWTHNSEFSGRSSKSPICTLVSNNTSITNGASRWHISNKMVFLLRRERMKIFTLQGKMGTSKCTAMHYIIPKKVFK